RPRRRPLGWSSAGLAGRGDSGAQGDRGGAREFAPWDYRPDFVISNAGQALSALRSTEDGLKSAWTPASTKQLRQQTTMRRRSCALISDAYLPNGRHITAVCLLSL